MRPPARFCPRPTTPNVKPRSRRMGANEDPSQRPSRTIASPRTMRHSPAAPTTRPYDRRPRRCNIRDVRDDDAARYSSRHVDVVVADAVGRDDLARGGRVPGGSRRPGSRRQAAPQPSSVHRQARSRRRSRPGPWHRRAQGPSARPRGPGRSRSNASTRLTRPPRRPTIGMARAAGWHPSSRSRRRPVTRAPRSWPSPRGRLIRRHTGKASTSRISISAYSSMKSPAPASLTTLRCRPFPDRAPTSCRG